MILETNHFSLNLLKNQTRASSIEQGVIIKKNGKKVFLPIVILTHVEALSNYSILHTVVGVSYISCKTLKYWTEVFADNFMRCHKSFLLNKRFFEQVNKNEIQLTNGVILPCSRRQFRKMQHNLTA